MEILKFIKGRKNYELLVPITQLQQLNIFLHIHFSFPSNIDMREKHQLIASQMHPEQGSNHNLGLCPNQESNLPPSGVQNEASTN